MVVGSGQMSFFPRLHRHGCCRGHSRPGVNQWLCPTAGKISQLDKPASPVHSPRAKRHFDRSNWPLSVRGDYSHCIHTATLLPQQSVKQKLPRVSSQNFFGRLSIGVSRQTSPTRVVIKANMFCHAECDKRWHLCSNGLPFRESNVSEKFPH